MQYLDPQSERALRSGEPTSSFVTKAPANNTTYYKPGNKTPPEKTKTAMTARMEQGSIIMKTPSKTGAGERETESKIENRVLTAHHAVKS